MGENAPRDGRIGLPPGALDGEGRPRFLVVCLAGLGDVVHALPVLHALRETYPDSEAGWLVDERLAPLIEGHPELARVHGVPREEWRWLPWLRRRRAAREFIKDVRRCGYTAAVDLHGNKSSAHLTGASGARIRLSYAPPEGTPMMRRQYTCRIVPGPRVKHIAERNLSLLVPLAVRRSEPVYVFPDFSAVRARLETRAGPFDRRYAVVHSGAAWPSAQWGVESTSELARRLALELSLRVLLTAMGDVERSRAAAVAKAAGSGTEVAPETGPAELAALLQGAALFAGTDGGPMHLASALGVPTVAVFGPTRAERRGPRGDRSRMIDSGLGCLGCGKRTCPYGTEACMKRIDPGAVFDLARELLA